jgi:hypothetical protein
LKVPGDNICRTTGFARNEILDDLKRSRIARRAGVQRIASPIGEGSQTRMFVFGLSFRTDLIFPRASNRRLAP